MTNRPSFFKVERLEIELWSLFFVSLTAFSFCGAIDYITTISLDIAIPLSFIYGIGMPLVIFIFKGEFLEQLLYYALLCLVFMVFSCMALLNGAFSDKSDLFYFAGTELFIDSIICIILFVSWVVVRLSRNKR